MDKLWFIGSIAMRYCLYTYAALLVQLCCTFGGRVLHFYGTIFLLVLHVRRTLPISLLYRDGAP